MINVENYKLKNPENLETPAMLVFEHLVDHNIRVLLQLVGNASSVMPHVKTHKMAAITRKHIEAGIIGFKASTLKEVQMVLEVGGQEVILAYPIIQPLKAERFACLCEAYPEANVYVAADSHAHLDVLGKAAMKYRRKLNVMLDMDVGMHRTGLSSGRKAEEVYGEIVQHMYLEPAGLHAYDGHDHYSDPVRRKEVAEMHISKLEAFRDRLIAQRYSVPRIVGGGSFSFPYFAHREGMTGSPGTTVLWDGGYAELMPDRPFIPAAVILTQAVDRHVNMGTVTFDLGHKAIACDPPLEKRARLVGRDDARLVVHNDEHGVFTMAYPLADRGDYFFALPGHVCPTTVRYPFSYVINRDGDVVGRWEHTARDR